MINQIYSLPLHSRSNSEESIDSAVEFKRQAIINRVNKEDKLHGNKNTERQYNSALNHFKEWCSLKNVDWNDFTIEDFELYIWYCYDLGTSDGFSYRGEWLDNKIKGVGRHFKRITMEKKKLMGIDLPEKDITIRTHSIKKALKTFKTKLQNNTKEHLKIKDKQFFNQHYETADYHSITNHLWGLNSKAGFKYLVDFLLGIKGLNRGIERRGFELSDMLIHDIDINGCKTNAFLLTVRAHKTQKDPDAPPIFSSYLRHLDFKLCSVGAVAFWIFYRIHYTNEVIIPFELQTWFSSKIFYGKNPQSTLTYAAHNDFVSKMHSTLDIDTGKKVTHCGRNTGSRELDLLGCSKDQAQRMGHWNSDRMTSCYLLDLPLNAMTLLAGGKDLRGGYRLARDLSPNDQLINKVYNLNFTELFSRLEHQKLELEHKKYCAIMMFLKSMYYLAKCVLQDAALASLNQNTKNNDIFGNSLFQDPLYIEFAAKVQSEQAIIDNTPLKSSTFFEEVSPEILQHLKDQRSISLATNSRISQLEDKCDHLIQLVTNAYVPPIFQSHMQNILPNPYNPPIATVNSRPEILTNTSELFSVNNEPYKESLHTDKEKAPKVQPNCFKMNRNITTITSAYKEWYEGINGGLSVKFVEETRKGWRKDNRDTKYFCRRRKIIQEIDRIALLRNTSGKTAAEIIVTYIKDSNQYKTQSDLGALERIIRTVNVENRSYL